MNRIVLLLFTGLHLSKIHCQPIVTDGSNKRIMEWDSSYNVETKWFRSDSFFENAYQYTIKRNEKVIAKYLRHDNQSFLFVMYDSTNWPVERGLIKYTHENFECEKFEIPDKLRDPDWKLGVLKDTIMCNGSYRKAGIWKEKDSIGMIWKGEYINGFKEGEWKEGISLHVYSPEGYIIEKQNDYFRPYIQHTYKNGFEISPFKDSLFWPKIKGKWFLDVSLSITTMILHRSGKRLGFDFKTASKVSFPTRSNECPDCFYELITTWKKENDFIKIDKSKKVFKVLELTDDELIIRFVEW